MYEYVAPEPTGNADRDLEGLYDALAQICKQLNYDVGVLEDIAGQPRDFVVAQGKADGWAYRKWKSGRIEAWKSVIYTGVNITNSWPIGDGVNLYESAEYSVPKFRLMKNIEQTQVTIQSASAGVLLEVYGTKIYFVRPTSISGVDITLGFYAIGT